MMTGYRNFDEIVRAVKVKQERKRCAVVLADSTNTLEGVLSAHREGIVEPLLIGDEDAIHRCLVEIGGSADAMSIIPGRSPEAAAQKAVDLVNSGQADMIMKGSIETSVLMSAVLNRKNGLRTGRIVSSFSMFEIPTYHKLLAMTDGGITLRPDLNQKKLIIENAVEALRRMGIPCPKVAVMAALETVNPKMPETVDAHALKEMNQRGEIKGCIIDGPISYDLALSEESARIKSFKSSVAGDADLMVCPDITSANMVGKALVFSARVRFGTCVIGAKIPIVQASRASTADEKFLSIILACAVG